MSVALRPFTLRKSDRARTIRVRVVPGGQIIVSAPTKVARQVIENFLRQNDDWLETKVEYFKKFSAPRLSASEEKNLFNLYKHKAEAVARKKVEQWNNHYKLSFKKIAIRNSKSRWGSCSNSGTISFNYKIAFLAEPLANYLVVHELCHLKESNHSANFWSLVSQTIPDYEKCRRDLREFEKTFKPQIIEV